MNTIYITQEELDKSREIYGLTRYTDADELNTALSEHYALRSEVEQVQLAAEEWFKTHVEFYETSCPRWNDEALAVYELLYESKLYSQGASLNDPISKRWTSHSSEKYPLGRWKKEIRAMKRYIKAVREAIS